MGSGASAAIKDASDEQLQAVLKELSPEDIKKLKDAVATAETKKGEEAAGDVAATEPVAEAAPAAAEAAPAVAEAPAAEAEPAAEAAAAAEGGTPEEQILQQLSGKRYTWAVNDSRLAGDAKIDFSGEGSNIKASVFCKRSEFNSGQWYDFVFRCSCDVQLKSLADGNAATFLLTGWTEPMDDGAESVSVSFTMELQGKSLIFFEPPELQTPRGPMKQCKLDLAA